MLFALRITTVTLAAVAALAGAAQTAAAATAPAEPILAPTTVNPPETGVLLLPPVDTEPWANHVLGQRQLVVRRRLQHDFIARRFKMYGETLAQAAADQSPKIDLVSPTARIAENLDLLAKRSGARWVVSVDVQEVAEDPQRSDGGAFHCFCRVNLKIWDASRHGWIANGPHVGLDHGDFSTPVWLFMESIDEATRGAIATLLEPYPTIVPIGEVGPVSDYLAGQTVPFVAPTNQPFNGLTSR